jgi:hypothetical protein
MTNLQAVGFVATKLPQLLFIFIATCLSVMKMKRISMDRKSHEKAFSIFVAILTVVASCTHLYLAVFGNVLTTNAVERPAVQSIDHGAIPAKFILFSMALPLITTPCGMNVRLAKTVCLFSSIVFVLTTYATYRRILSNPSCVDGQCSDRLFALANDFMVALATISISYSTCVPSSDVSIEFVELLKAGRVGDCALNHVLKNTIAGASCLLEMEQAQHQDRPISEFQKEALSELYSAMRWCSSRQLFLDLSSGRYRSVLSPVAINSFLTHFRQGKSPLVVTTVERTLEGANELCFDETMANLAMENALSNAKAHGVEGTAISLSASFQAGPEKKIIPRFIIIIFETKHKVLLLMHEYSNFLNRSRKGRGAHPRKNCTFSRKRSHQRSRHSSPSW